MQVPVLTLVLRFDLGRVWRGLAVAIPALALGLAACGAQGGSDGGAERLPDRGLIPYEKITAIDENPPFIFGPQEGRVLVEPSGVVEGGQVVLFLESRIEGDEGSRQIVRALSQDGGLTFGPASIALSAPQGVGSPSVLRVGDRWLMAVELGGTGALGLATSDDGVTFALDGAPLLEPEGDAEAGGLGGPSLVKVGQGFDLYYDARPLAVEGQGTPTPVRPFIARATAGADLAFIRAGIVLQGGEGCVNGDGVPEGCWDGEGVESPELRRAIASASGRTVLRLMYTGVGRGGVNVGVGVAASFDGERFSRFEFNPIMAQNRRERDPTNVLIGNDYLLYFTDRVNAAFGVGLALNRADSPSEQF